MLQRLAADIERQIIAINDAAHKAQIARHQSIAFLGDEDPLHIEPQAMRTRRIEQIERPHVRHIEESGIFKASLGAHMHGHPGIAGQMRHMAIKFLVLILADVTCGTGPQRRAFVERFRHATIVEQLDGQGDMVGIGGNDMADA